MRAASVDAADGGATLDNSCGYHQILLSRVVGRGRLNQFVPEIVIIFSGQPTSSIGHEQRWRPFVLRLEHISSAVIKDGAIQKMGQRQS